MKKGILFLCFFWFLCVTTYADEGMWLPSLISQRVKDMQKNGFRLTAEDVYSINQASLKDAIVHFGGGCTGELISGDGLLITNHHCGFGQIQSHSSPEHDYLKNGFWAMDRSQELPNKGLAVRFLVRMEDVTEAVLKGVIEQMAEKERSKQIADNQKAIQDAAINGTHYQAKIESLYYGNQYFIFVYETFNDVRLVGAPPSSIGKFGGDTDNWMWPRHTGDFSMFRIYAGKDNKPAAYSADNIPYKPKKFLSIATKGIKEGDFTMIYGYPGRTQEYIHSAAIRYIQDCSNPHKIRLRTLRLEIMNEEMGRSVPVRIQYASKHASVANSWKKWQGERNGLVRMGTVAQKEDFEQKFIEWAKGKPEYANIVPELGRLYASLSDYAFAADYHTEALISVELVRFAGGLMQTMEKEAKAQTTPEKARSVLKELLDDFYKDYYLPIDQRSFSALMKEYCEHVPERFRAPIIAEQIAKYNDIDHWAQALFAASLLGSKERAIKWVQGTDLGTALTNDPAYILYKAYMVQYEKSIRPQATAVNEQLALLYRNYMRGQMEFAKNKVFYPDANSTLRVAYGKIKGYAPSDAVYYWPISTLEGIIEKDNPNIYDYDIPLKLRDVYVQKDYGRWAVNGTVPVAFIATNHTSGGNSGSPVLNAKGELLGLNFDRVWEGTMSDLAYDPDMCRNIAVDIRYVLFVVDKVAGAGYLLREMHFAK